MSDHLYRYRRKVRAPRRSSSRHTPTADPTLGTFIHVATSPLTRSAPFTRSQVVRDLAWSLTSPHLLSDDATSHDVVLLTDEHAAGLLEDAHGWLLGLDEDPSHLTRWVGAQRGANKLGFYFGALVEYAARFCPSIGARAVTTRRQIAGALGTGKMVGQLKLVMLRSFEPSFGGVSRRHPPIDAYDDAHDADEVTHWEYNVKYFIDAGGVVSPARRWHAAETLGVTRQTSGEVSVEDVFNGDDILSIEGEVHRPVGMRERCHN